MQLILIIIGVILGILGILMQLGIVQRMGYQLVRLPGYLYVALGVIIVLSGFFLG
jgi:hypothetical protein